MLEASGPNGIDVREAGTAAEAMEAAASQPPDVALVDVVLPDGDGIQLCRDLQSEHPEVACLILTSLQDERTLLAAAMAGAKGFLRKDVGRQEILEAVRMVAAGESLLDDRSMTAALERLRVEGDEDPVLAELTPQERRVFELIGQGLSNRQIGEQLFLSEKTVKNYVSRVLAKLHMDRRTEVAVLSARLAERRSRGGPRSS